MQPARPRVEWSRIGASISIFNNCRAASALVLEHWPATVLKALERDEHELGMGKRSLDDGGGSLPIGDCAFEVAQQLRHMPPQLATPPRRRAGLKPV